MPTVHCHHCNGPIGEMLAASVSAAPMICLECARKRAVWPRKATVYLHSSREQMRDCGEKLGLEDAALNMFAYACDEVELEMEVNADGSSSILGAK
jgi:hypothetical protein